MRISSAVFMRGIKGDDPILSDGLPQVAFIGRSNAGKSTLINTLTGVKDLARTSSTPGRTQELNVFLVNKSHYFIDLPGYGFAKTTFEAWQKLNKMIYWYLFRSEYNPKIVLVIDGEIGPTPDDLGMLKFLLDHKKDVVVVANKIDKIKKSNLNQSLERVRDMVFGVHVIAFSSKAKVGTGELLHHIIGRR